MFTMYAIQDKTWVLDPDGNEWEVFVVLEDNLPETATSYVSGGATSVDVTAAAGAATPQFAVVSEAPCCTPTTGNC